MSGYSKYTKGSSGYPKQDNTESSQDTEDLLTLTQSVQKSNADTFYFPTSPRHYDAFESYLNSHHRFYSANMSYPEYPYFEQHPLMTEKFNAGTEDLLTLTQSDEEYSEHHKYTYFGQHPLMTDKFNAGTVDFSTLSQHHDTESQIDDQNPKNTLSFAVGPFLTDLWEKSDEHDILHPDFDEKSSQNGPSNSQENESEDSHSDDSKDITESAETPIDHYEQLNKWLSLCSGPCVPEELYALENYFVFAGKMFFMGTSDSTDITRFNEEPKVKKINDNLERFNSKHKAAKDFKFTALCFELFIKKLITQELLYEECLLYKTKYFGNYSIVMVPCIKWTSIKFLLGCSIYSGFYGTFVVCFYFCGHYVVLLQHDAINKSRLTLNEFTLRQIMAFLSFLEHMRFRLPNNLLSSGMFLDDRENIGFRLLNIDRAKKSPDHNSLLIRRFLLDNQNNGNDHRRLKNVIDFLEKGYNPALSMEIQPFTRCMIGKNGCSLDPAEKNLPNVFLFQVRGNYFHFFFYGGSIHSGQIKEGDCVSHEMWTYHYFLTRQEKLPESIEVNIQREELKFLVTRKYGTINVHAYKEP